MKTRTFSFQSHFALFFLRVCIPLCLLDMIMTYLTSHHRLPLKLSDVYLTYPHNGSSSNSAFLMARPMNTQSLQRHTVCIFLSHQFARCPDQNTLDLVL